MAEVLVRDLRPEDVLGEDVYKGNALALKRGKVLTKEWIDRLHRWGIEAVEIQHGNEPVEKGAQMSEQELKRLFLENVIGLGNEYRFGFALNDQRRYEWLENLFCSIMKETKVKALMDKLEDWDPYTYQHSFDVFILGSLLAYESDFPNLRETAIGCLLHDVGKLKVPQEILWKKGALNGSEMAMVQTHPLAGYELLKEFKFSENIAVMARDHHERLNGRGYPYGIAGHEISQQARLIGVLDIYSALSLDRPYRNAVCPHKAIRIILQEESVDVKYVARLCETLEIFPLGATVELTDRRTATIIKIDDKLPTFPLLKEEGSARVFYVPTNRTLRIRRMLIRQQTDE
ncbi:HD-GYP domain-containing protein [Marinococcus luteus]|uniref:HD-GYP domain-containing protein n=1 Tax=Marinococcus luteus TaxID=1122204 RepID=UPI002ACC50A4|nr:HD domain-containing phosphohydrolase [Marinococcus luteus]MDZ5784184.1 HD domain-containing phosphohydrolase [Marinococcus luteus]